MTKNTILRAFSLFLTTAGLACGQTTRALYDFADVASQASIDTDLDTTASDFDVNPTGALTGSGSGPSFSSSSFSAFVRCSQTSATTLADAIANDQYSNFTITVDNGPQSISNFAFRHFVTSFNATVDYNVAVMTSLTGFTDGDEIEVIQPSTAATTGITSDILLLDPAFTDIAAATVIEFRLYYFDDSSAQSQIYRIDDVEVFIQDLPDPLFNLSAGTANSDFNFPNTFSTGSDLTRALTYEVSSESGSGTVAIDALTLTNDPAHTTSSYSVTSVPAIPVTLNDGETITITVTADGTESGEFTGSLAIDTTSAGGNQPVDIHDTTLNISSVFFENGEKLNTTNGSIEGGTNGWGGFPSFVEPGIAPNSSGLLRVKGLGDPAGANAPDSAFQSAGVVDGASDFELTAFFTPIAATAFADYTNNTPSGAFADRTFQWVLLSEDTMAAAATNFDNTSAAASLINLAYLPDGNLDGGTPDFYLFDGTNWVATGIGAIQGSIDNDTDGDLLNGVGDGLLDTSVDPLDIINAYRLSVKGTGFGTPSASYDISVTKTAGPDTFTSGSATSLTVFHNVSGTTGTPAGYTFTTADTSTDPAFGSNTSNGFQTTFWIDEVCFSNVAFPDPSMSLSTDSLSLTSHNASPVTPTGTVTISNGGISNDLTISSLTLSGGSSISILSPTVLPIVLSPGTSQDVEVQFTPATIAPLTADIATLTVVSDAFADATQTVLVQALTTTDNKLIANWDFEVAGTDNVNDLDTFAGWDEGASDAIRAQTTDVPSLISGSSTAAYLNRSDDAFAEIEGALEGGATSNISLEFYLAISEPITEATATEESSRIFNVIILSAQSNNLINIRYVEENSGSIGSFQAFQAGWQDLISLSSPLNPSVAVNGDGDLSAAGSTSNVYRLKLDATGIGSADASYSLEIFDTDGTSLGQSADSSIFQNPAATTQSPDQVRFSTEFGENSPFWVDEACASILTIAEDIVITDCNFAGPGDDFIINFTGAASTTYNVEASANLVDDFAPISGVTATTNASGIGTATVPAASVGSERNFFRISE